MPKWLTVTLLAFAALPAAVADAGWGTREPVSGAGEVYLTPTGFGWVSGFFATNPSRYRIRPRPVTGVLGDPQEYPGTSGQEVPQLAFDAQGNAIVWTYGSRHVAYRSADGGAPFDEVMGDTNHKPRLVSVASTGEAMIGFQGNNLVSGPIKVAFRPAGATAPVAEESAESFSTNGVLIGLLLQDDGGAIVVWREGDQLWQSVRPSGSASFTPKTEITQPGDARKVEVRFVGARNGRAMLAWTGSTQSGGTFRADRALASVRAPDGSFPAATVVATNPHEQGVAAVQPAITENGPGLAAWFHRAGPGCARGMVMSSVHQGGSFASPTQIGPGGMPSYSDLAWLSPLAAGDRIAVAVRTGQDTPNTPCDILDDDRRIVVRHYHAAAGVLAFDGETELARVELRPDGTPIDPTLAGLALEPGGKMLALLDSEPLDQLVGFDGVVTPVDGGNGGNNNGGGGGGANGGGGGGGAGGGGSGTGGGSGAATTPALPAVVSPDRPRIAPIVPRNFVTIRPLDPNRPFVVVQCTPNATDPCEVQTLYYLMGSKRPTPIGVKKPTAATAQKRKLKVFPLGRASATLKPGERRRLPVRLTPLGRQWARSGRAVKVRVEVRVTRSGRTVVEQRTTTLKAAKKRKRRQPR